MRPLFIVACAAITLLAQSAGGLKWTVPQGWTSSAPPGPMRAATYSIPAAAGDKENAECIVYFFGQGQGGTAQANIDRWKGMVTVNGKPAPAQVGTKTAHGMKVTTIDSSGEYSAGQMAKGGPKPGYRMLGAIIEGPKDNNLFVKFTGPAKTVAANQQKFDALIASFDKQ